MTATAEFEALYTEYRSKVLAYIRSHISDSADAEDLCADVFEKALRRWDDYDPARAAPGTWLFSITRNAVIDHYRRARPTEELPEALSDDALPEDGVMQEALLEELAAALEKLPDELTDLIVLRYYDGLPLTEIAERMDMSYGMVKIRHNKALSLLRAAMMK